MLSIDYPVDNLFIINNNGRGEINEELDKYSLVRKYLLNESESMAGKKILWIHKQCGVQCC